MKKVGLLILSLLLIVSCLSFVSALNIVYKESYLPRETLIAKISGDIRMPLAAEDIAFYKGYKEAPMEYDLANINGSYYLYALLPETEGNYSFIIKNITYIQGRATKKESFENNFTISGNATLQVSPAFVVASKPFSIYLENFGASGEFKAEFFDQEYPLTIIHNDASTVTFSLPEDEDFGYINIYGGELKLYEIPVKIINKNQSVEIDPTQLAFKDKEINASLKIGEEWKITIELHNYASTDIGNVNLRVIDLEDYVSLEEESVNIASGTPALIDLTIESEDIGIKKGWIEAEYNGIITNISLNLAFTENTTSISSDSTSSTCQGTICSSDKQCSLQVYSIGVAECCPSPGVCQDGTSNGDGSSGLLTGILIIAGVLVVGVGIYYFVKKKSVKGDVLKSQSEKYDRIMQGK